MIRRLVGKEYWLITQDDHAKAAGTLAAGLGNGGFFAPSSASAITGISMHDSGWPIHDDRPTLNPHGEPRDVFESTREVALPVWEASAERAAAVDPYAGLLVSLHGLALSAYATVHSPLARDGKWDLAEPRVRFEVNRFQHRMIEMQESIRTQVGLRIDQPLHQGLAEGSTDPSEQQLSFDFRWLQAMDQISLSICCTKPPFEKIGPILPRPGAAGVWLRVRRPRPEILMLEPWPFATTEVSVQIPFRRLPATPFANDAELHTALTNATLENFTVRLGSRTM